MGLKEDFSSIKHPKSCTLEIYQLNLKQQTFSIVVLVKVKYNQTYR